MVKRLLEATPLRAGVVAAVALTGALLTSAPAGAATAGQTAVTVTQTDAASRPGNGRIIYDRISGGRGVLKIKNGTSKDGVVTIVRGSQKAVSIYVRARSSARISDVRDGTYRIYFTTGYRFSSAKGRFTRSATYQRFTDRLRFRTTSRQYTIWTLTLNPVRGGNARTTQVNPKDFP